MKCARLAVAMCMILAIATACHPRGEPLTFQAVDGLSGQPLAGVRVAQESFAGRDFRRDHDYGPTGPDGKVVADNVYRNASNLFLFTLAGRLPSEVVRLANEDERHVSVLAPLRPRRYAGPPTTQADARAPIKVPLYPMTRPTDMP